MDIDHRIRKYVCLCNQKFKIGSYYLKTVQDSQIEKIRLWRNAQIDVLRQREEISFQEQKAYYEKHVWEEMNHTYPNKILFSFFETSTHIGYGGLTNISWENKRAELSFILDNERAKKDSTYFTDFNMFLKLIKLVIFDSLKFNRIFTETYDIRSSHIRILELNGFNLEGRLLKHNLIKGSYIDSLIHGCIKK